MCRQIMQFSHLHRYHEYTQRVVVDAPAGLQEESSNLGLCSGCCILSEARILKKCSFSPMVTLDNNLFTLQLVYLLQPDLQLLVLIP